MKTFSIEPRGADCCGPTFAILEGGLTLGVVHSELAAQTLLDALRQGPPRVTVKDRRLLVQKPKPRWDEEKAA